jgi:hypothetical protein
MKTITFTCHNERGTTAITERFHEDCGWNSIAYSFQKFLASIGYILDSEDVGADVASYIGSAPEENEGW